MSSPEKDRWTRLYEAFFIEAVNGPEIWMDMTLAVYHIRQELP